MTGNAVPENLKGKAVLVEHFLFDELWNLGDKKAPVQIEEPLQNPD